jgi:TM2 domain-containing membrane protein YozV
MATEWFYTQNGDRRGPVSESEIKALAAEGRLRPDDLVWQAGMAEWTAAGKVPHLFAAGGPPPMPDRGPPRPVAAAYQPSSEIADAQTKKIAAAICGILIGSFGIHKFIIGNNTAGIIMLLVTLLTCGIGGLVMHVIGIAEGIIYLTKSDADFYQTYIVEQKAWF